VSADELALSFGRAADGYERGRPEWPDEAVDYAVERLALSPEAHVLDLAAGTGKLTRKLVRRFRRVIAVEPNDAMRQLLETIVPEAEARKGTARAIPLGDGDVDAVFVGEAFHWFAGREEVGEITRVLAACGGLVLLWHRPAEENLLPRGFGGDARTDRQRPTSGIWRDAFLDSAFELMHEKLFEHVQQIDREGVLAYFSSISSIASLPEDERGARMEHIAAQLDRETYERHWQVEMHWTRLSE
jgi:ubiquinone/menaquinone biosynthesis C-methylase UbiE